MEKLKKMKVSAIKNGTVIDHISAKDLFKIVEILNLEKVDNPITFGTNLESKKLGKKGVIKISDKFFLDKEIDKIAIISPKARLNLIRDYKVFGKKDLKIPNEIHGIVKCVNPKCITNFEKITQKFEVLKESEKVSLKCKYCGKITGKKNIVLT